MNQFMAVPIRMSGKCILFSQHLSKFDPKLRKGLIYKIQKFL